METTNRVWQWGVQHKKRLLIIGLILGVLVGLTLWLRGVEVKPASLWGIITAVIPNIPFIWSSAKGVSKVITMGIKQAELDQKIKKRLLEIEQSQRQNPDANMVNIVDSVGYKKGITSTAHFVLMHTLFINFLFFPLEILSCKIYLAYPDETQINCLGSNNQIEPKEIEISDNDKKLKAVKINKVDLRIYIPDVVIQRIKDSANQSTVQYSIHIKWRLKSEYFDEHVFNDYLSFQGVPDLNAE